MVDGDLKIIPLGGLGEIGLNCLALEWREQLLVIDAGLMFPDPASMPGVDLVIPDFSYLRERGDKVLGLILTHGHEDHIGAAGYLLKELGDCPVFGTRLTLALAEERLRESGLSSPRLLEVQPRQKLRLGPFDLEFIRVSHSILDGLAVAVSTPLGVVLHTGDFKIDQNPDTNEQIDLYKFAEYGEKGVLALLSDSTNADVPGFADSELVVGQSLEKIFREIPGRIILTCFASSLARIQQVTQAARSAGRRLAFDGRSMTANVKLAKSLGYLRIEDEDQIFLAESGQLPDRELVVVVTGSQGEPMSALSRMAYGEHKHLHVRPGDTVIISARFIPGHEKAITQLIDRFYRLGAKVIDGRVHKVHASGHGQAEELKLMLNLTRPRYLVPIHGETRQLVRHGQLALDLGWDPDRIKVLGNGRSLTIPAEGRAEEGPLVPTGRKLVDGNRLGEPEDPVLRSRLRLADGGLVVISLALSAQNYQLLAPPLVNIQGVHYESDQELSLETAEAARRVVEQWRAPANHLEQPDREELAPRIQQETRLLFRQTLSRRPAVWPQILWCEAPPEPAGQER